MKISAYINQNEKINRENHHNKNLFFRWLRVSVSKRDQ